MPWSSRPRRCSDCGLIAVRTWQALLVILVVLGLAWADRVYLDSAVLVWFGHKLFAWTNWIAFWH